MFNGDSDRQHSRSTAIRRWFLLDGNRWEVVLLLSVSFFLIFVILGTGGVIGVTEKSLVVGILGPSLTGIFTLVTITTSINQLVLSRILGSPEDIVSRTESVKEFREDIEEQNPRTEVSPIQPAVFLRSLSIVIEDRIKQLQHAFRDHPTEQIDELSSKLLESTEGIFDALDDDDMHLFPTFSPVLDDEYSIHLHTIRHLKQDRSELTNAQLDALKELESALLSMNYTRHYFKTLYIHEALADVSLYVFLAGLPSLALGYVTILSYDTGPVLSGISMLLAMSLIMVVILLPLTILFAYLVRIITIAKRTATFGTFTPVEEMP